MKIFIVIAAYKETGSIGKVVKNLRKSYKNIIVVDDGSKDGTSEEAKNSGAIVLNHVINRGQGAALQTGITCALDNKADIIVTFDADGQHQVKDLKKMIPLVVSGKYDVILGSRFLKGAKKIPSGRKFLLRGSIIFQRFLYGVKLTDAHNGLRVLSRKAAQNINITSDKMEHASEIAEQIFKKKLKYKEVPVDILYNDETLDKGHGSFFGAMKIAWQFFVRKLLR